MRWFGLSADRAGGDIVLNITTKFLPPEPSFQERNSSINPWMARQLGGVGPLQHLGSDLDGDEKSIFGTSAGCGSVGQGIPYDSFDLHLNSVDEYFVLGAGAGFWTSGSNL